MNELLELQKHLESTQHILGHVLKVIGEPVVVPKADLAENLGGNYLIEMNESEDAFTFFLVEVPDGQ